MERPTGVTILAVLNFIGALFCVLGSLLHFQLFGLVFRLVFVAIYALILWYLFQPRVKQAFGAT
jgi:membrane protein implicated in regulation of membrane protease activity